MNFFAIIKLAIQLIPILQAIIIAIQQAFPNSAGSDKLAIARTMLQTAAQAAPDIEAEFETVWKLAEPLIASIVLAYHSDGTIAAKA